MAGQIIPINDIASAGVVVDMPAVSLAENIFTDCLNVRFRDGAVRKMEGEEAITTPFTDSILYVAFWNNPNLGAGTGYYIVVTNNGSVDKITAIKTSASASQKDLKKIDNLKIDLDKLLLLISSSSGLSVFIISIATFSSPFCSASFSAWSRSVLVAEILVNGECLATIFSKISLSGLTKTATKFVFFLLYLLNIQTDYIFYRITFTFATLWYIRYVHFFQ